MPTPLKQKSTPEQIRARFDGDVERFANLDTGQVATIDAPLAMELITQAAVAATPVIRRVLDIGCGAGNSALKLLQSVPGGFACDLLDLSRPMLERAVERVSAVSAHPVRTFQADFRTAELPDESYDVILAAAVLHHFRDDADWEAAFARLYRLTAPGGSVWITDLVTQETEAVQDLMWQRYGDYLIAAGGESYRDQVFATIDREDSPRPVTYQLDLLRRVGFSAVELLHKNACFAAFGAIKRAG
jgi:tRNA (cmo5U34)-methyltransferase